MTPHIVSGNTITAFVNGELRTIDGTHPNFVEIRHRLRDNKPVADLFDVVSALTFLYEDDLIKVGVDTLFYNDAPLHNYLTQRIIDMARRQLPLAPWIAFLKKVQLNPDPTIRNQLFDWLEKSGMPITPDGYFLAYKKVRDDYKSFHDGETRNDVGSTIFMPREDCDTDRNRTCSTGLHFCAYSYLRFYQGDQGKVVLLKINPADVTSFPSDDAAKGRACRYTVIDELPASEVEWAFDYPVYEDVWDEPEPENLRREGFFPSIFGRIRAFLN